VPIFLIILFKFFYKTKWFNYILGFVLIFTFAISQYMAIEYKSLAYYGLPARFFELFIGVWLAVNYQKLPVSNNKYVNNTLAVVSLLLILIPALLISKLSVFPGYNALFVCLGSAGLIYLGKCEEKTFITKFLGLKAVVFIGLISYSLYLWHWPVFATFKTIGLEFNHYEMLAIIALLIALSYISWKFVEQPFRNKFKWSFLTTFIVFLVVPIAIFYGCKYAIKKYNFATDRISYNQELIKTSATAHAQKKLCINAIRDDKTYTDELCSFGEEDKKLSVFMFGDSHSNSAAGFIEELMLDSSLKAKINSNSSYLYLKDKMPNKSASVTNLDQMKVIYKSTDQEIISKKYDYIVISGLYNSYYNYLYGKDTFKDGIEETVEFILENESIPVIVKDVARFKNMTGYCVIFNRANCSIDKNTALEKQIEIDSFFDELKIKYPQLILIDPKEVMCDDEKCYYGNQDAIFYSDDHHLTYYGSRYLGKKYLEKFGNPFKHYEEQEVAKKAEK